MEISSSKDKDVKHIYRSVFHLVKHLDELKTNIHITSEIFSQDINKTRNKLMQYCEVILLQQTNDINIEYIKKSRDILWRKGYYDFITIAKNSNFIVKNNNDDDKNLKKFLLTGIINLKRIIILLEKLLSLDIRYMINFNIINNINITKHININNFNIINNPTLEQITIAYDTIHSLLISIGDLHRYYIDFNFHKIANDTYGGSDDDYNDIITIETTANYYNEAFKLNPNIGMSQNQLGTLFTNNNYNLDSIYHYMYSLTCRIPFVPSENNIITLFQLNADYLEKTANLNNNFSSENYNNDDDDDDSKNKDLKDFLTNFILIIDIFFYDKNINDFNNLCHIVLINLRKILLKKLLNDNLLLKMLSLLLFCLIKLRTMSSIKIHQLNAFLIAILSELIDACINNFNDFLQINNDENVSFLNYYNEEYDKFYKSLKMTRKLLRDDKINDENVKVENGEEIIENTKIINADNNDDIKLINSNEINNKKRYIGNLLNRRRRKRHLSSNSSNTISGTASDSDSENDSNCEEEGDLDAHNNHDDNDDNLSDNDHMNELTDYNSSCDSLDDEDDDDYLSDFVDTDEDDDGGEDLKLHKKNEKQNKLNETPNMHDDIQQLNDNYINKVNELIEQQEDDDLDVLDNDNDDIIIEDEKTIYLNDIQNSKTVATAIGFDNFKTTSTTATTLLDNQFSKLSINNATNNNNDDIIIEEDKLIFIDNDNAIANENSNLKYRRKYNKNSPTLIINFLKNDSTIKIIKILFDWLKINNNLLINCYQTNPEFIDKIIKLINLVNIDIITHKIFYPKKFLNDNSIHNNNNINVLFEKKINIAIEEDILFKKFDLFNKIHDLIDWELNLRLNINKYDEAILRLYKMIDFGYYLCKIKIFSIKFCSKQRLFIKNKNSINNHNDKNNHNTQNNNNRRSKNKRMSKRNLNKKFNQNNNNNINNTRNNKRKNYFLNKIHSNNNNNKINNIDDGTNGLINVKKVYLKNKNREEEQHHQQSQLLVQKHQIPTTQHQQHPTSSKNIIINYNNSNNEINKTNIKNIIVNDIDNNDALNNKQNKYELMSKLWLANEVKTLESKVKKPSNSFNLTPYLVMDSKSLTEYTNIVKNLVKSKKFLILIPNAVLSELDELKKTSDNARQVIRWLELEFSKGNRFLRSQRQNENQQLSYIKIPKKIDRDATTFLQIIQFCNYLVENHTTTNNNLFLLSNNNNKHNQQELPYPQPNGGKILTLLTGDKILDKKLMTNNAGGIMGTTSNTNSSSAVTTASNNNFSYMGLINTITLINCEQISIFYDKFKKKF